MNNIFISVLVLLGFMALNLSSTLHGKSLEGQKEYSGSELNSTNTQELDIQKIPYLNNDNAAIKREQIYQCIQAYTLAKSLYKRIKIQTKCIIIYQPVTKQQKKYIETIVSALKQGLGEKITFVKTVPLKDIKENEIKKIKEDDFTNLNAKDFNNILAANKDCRLVISLVPLPFGEEELFKIDNFKLIEDPKKPGNYIKDPKINYPIIGIYNGCIGNSEQLFHEKLIHGMTVWKPEPEIDELPAPKDFQKAFDKRFLLITPENIKEHNKNFPDLFPIKR